MTVEGGGLWPGRWTAACSQQVLLGFQALLCAGCVCTAAVVKLLQSELTSLSLLWNILEQTEEALLPLLPTSLVLVFSQEWPRILSWGSLSQEQKWLWSLSPFQVRD